jgi:AGCS family alanine or glycine:cation symporter
MEALWGFINALNGILFSDVTVYSLLITGVVFTIWSGFSQYRSLTHGVAIVLGKYDDHEDTGPGAITHFQALSTALSATVGLGNIAGVAVAVALGGPGAVLWMWVIGVLGMALKTTEVTQSMLYRDTSNPDEPHGGPMFVVKEGMKKWGLGAVGSGIGGIFVVTLIISAVTGGNMFQAWNVAEVTQHYFSVPSQATGIILAVMVGMVILGGIKRIGSVASKLVPGMCAVYLLAALAVLAVNFGEIPAMFKLIIVSGLPEFLGGSSAGASGAFIGGTVGSAAVWGIKRALFSSEAGQGSAPIAHAAVKTKEPVSEGVVAGLEPFIDTIVVCTLTALVILSSGAWNRSAEATFAVAPEIVQGEKEGKWTLKTGELPHRNDEAKVTKGVEEGAGWSDKEKVFMLLSTGIIDEEKTGTDIVRMSGVVRFEDDKFFVDWKEIEAAQKPQFVKDTEAAKAAMDLGVYGDYAGASLTAYSFDRVIPGLGKWLIPLAAWLFALSTIISWSYYGEQGIVYLVGEKGILPYRIVYCLLTVVACLGFITTDVELDAITTLGLGVMLVANIPIMWLFGKDAMGAYHSYFARVKSGEIKPVAKKEG